MNAPVSPRVVAAAGSAGAGTTPAIGPPDAVGATHARASRLLRWSRRVAARDAALVARVVESWIR